MKVKEAKSRINNIEEYKKMLEVLSDNEQRPFFKDVLKSSNKMLEEYKLLLLDMIENAEI